MVDQLGTLTNGPRRLPPGRLLPRSRQHSGSTCWFQSFKFAYRLGSFRRPIARRRAGAAGRDHQRAVLDIAQRDELFLNLRPLVRDATAAARSALPSGKAAVIAGTDSGWRDKPVGERGPIRRTGRRGQFRIS
jgi:hypothetical protein